MFALRKKLNPCLPIARVKTRNFVAKCKYVDQKYSYRIPHVRYYKRIIRIFDISLLELYILYYYYC